MYSIPMGGTLVPQKYAIGGSGSSYIYGYCDANFKDNMNEEESVEFVRKCLSRAIYRDGSSGGVIRTMIISKQGKQRETILPYFRKY